MLLLMRSLPLARRALRRAAHCTTALSIESAQTTNARTFSSNSAPPEDDNQDDSSSSKQRGEPQNDPAAASTTAPSSWLEEARETYARARARKHVFDEYVAEGVFQPSGSRLVRLSSWYLFYQLNRPRETQVDMVEFLEGAKYAMETTMLAMYSREFAAFANSNKNSTMDLGDSNSAHMLSRTLEPVSLEAFTEFVRFSSAAGIRSELQKLELHSAHVVGVSFTRVPTRPTTNSTGAVVVGVPMHERLAIQVLFDVTEHFKMTLPGENGDEESAIDDEDVVVRHNKAVWQFSSNVTTVDDIDWTIEPLDLATV